MLHMSQKSVKQKNTWYVLSKLNKNNKRGFTPYEKKGIFYETLEQAIQRKDYLEKLRNEKIYILERTCKVIL